ncbi:MAG: DUF1566 domain-containing protein [Leptospiraceae bacterium]|nr:DUF1566 domain-containing protein [Leptospiraceae bacterium]
MSFKLILFLLLGLASCFQPHRSPFDTNTPKGLVYQIQVQTEIRNSKTVIAPKFSLEPGVYPKSQIISISTATENAIIHYTMDNSEPNKDSPIYTNPILIQGHEAKLTLKAYAEKEGMYDSNVVDGTWEIKYNPVEPPILQAPNSGTYTTPQFITLSSATSDAKIYYTIDGTEPTTSSLPYTHPIGIWSLLGQSVTIKFIAVKEEHLDSVVVTTTVGPFQMPPLKTGQTNNYSQLGSDGDLQKGLPRGYTDNLDGTITDNTTGLVWQKCTSGQENDSTCSGTATTSNFAGAEAYCANLQLAGKSWRVPSLLELETLIDFSSSQGIQTTYFPNPQNIYWTSTPYPNSTIYNWRVHFNNPSLPGATYFSNKAGLLHTRCVSGPRRDYIPNAQNFTDNGNGTLTDKSTGLGWQKCISGQTWNSGSCIGTQTPKTWTAAFSDCSNLTLGGTWRLPNLNELKSIMDMTKSNPFLDTIIFPSSNLTDGQGLWSSSTDITTNSNALLLVAADGRLATNMKSSSYYYFRCVSD